MLNKKEIVGPQYVTTDELQLPELNAKDLSIDVLRLDKIDPIISGNKWFKLTYFLEEAIQQKCKTIITFGGAYSNHIIATACAANRLGFHCVGMVRGEEPSYPSRTLLAAKEFGMELIFLSRSEYDQRDNEGFITDLISKYPDSLVIPEGGSGTKGIKGSSEIWKLVKPNRYTHLLCAVATGTTFLGLANVIELNQQIIGICVLKGMHDLLQEKMSLLNDSNSINNYSIKYDYHFGGYAKKNDELFDFMNYFYSKTAIPTDFVYTGKLFFGALDLVKKNFFPAGSNLLVIHTGGLQGNNSLAKTTLNFN
jgi:1-aminocyclopropane-1-carboxylate deaminase